MNVAGSAIDWQLCIKLANDKEELARELLGIYVDELPKYKIKIKQAYTSGDFAELHAHVHKLHSSSCYCGVPRVKEIACLLEAAIKQHDEQDIVSLVGALYQRIDEVLAAYASGEY